MSTPSHRDPDETSSPAAGADARAGDESENGRLLVLDDDPDMCTLLEMSLRRRGYEVETNVDVEKFHAMLDAGGYDAVLVDLNLGTENGLDVCRSVSTAHPGVPPLLMTAYGTLESAIDAIRAGVYDFVVKPIDIDALDLALRRAVRERRLQKQVKRLQAEIQRAVAPHEMIGRDASMQQLYDLIGRVAASDTSVLITGESGTGKELVARAIHDQSSRSEAPFVAINCAAVPENLLESELFGHVRGAFTDAKNSRRGLFCEASGGTLFLDEIGEMPVEMQAKLLRALQERRVRPVGGAAEIAFDTRVITATNRDLAAEVEAGRFRQDLYYRVNVINVHVPSLSERGQDVLLLAQHFLSRFVERTGSKVTGFTTDAASKLMDYDWPGNVRELENAIERAVTLARYEQITVDDLPDSVRLHETTRSVLGETDPGRMPPIEQMERSYIHQVLKAVRGNKSRAARILGLDRRTLYRKLQRYDSESAPAA